jgi:GNAT superfamily N-acetyltransferase
MWMVEDGTMSAYDVNLPEGYTLRLPGPGDLETVHALIATCEEADEGSAEITLDDVRGSWERQRFDLKRDAWLVEAPGGNAVAFADAWPREDYSHMEADGYVHPAHRAKGIGRWLVRTVERRAREIAHQSGRQAATLLRSIVFAGTPEACDLFESEGFTRGRRFWRMVIDLRAATPEPRWPDGVSVRTFEQGDALDVHALIQDAFSDNHRHVRTGFEDWREAMMSRESFDPALWFLAVSEGEIVGAALCPDYPHQGWVRQLAVAREWRGHGVGAALLRHAFREFARRGKVDAGLVVDSFNRSGAQDFYIGVGMQVEREHQEFEKEVGP